MCKAYPSCASDGRKRQTNTRHGSKQARTSVGRGKHSDPRTMELVWETGCGLRECVVRLRNQPPSTQSSSRHACPTSQHAWKRCARVRERCRWPHHRNYTRCATHTCCGTSSQMRAFELLRFQQRRERERGRRCQPNNSYLLIKRTNAQPGHACTHSQTRVALCTILPRGEQKECAGRQLHTSGRVGALGPTHLFSAH
jgi:hypothetical protein